MVECVKMIVSGLPALVPVEHAKNVQKKQILVNQAIQLQKSIKSCNGFGQEIFQEQLKKTMAKIRNLNRRIPPCVKFI